MKIWRFNIEYTGSLNLRIKNLINNHKKIHAIKLCRMELGYGLLEAKNYVEDIESKMKTIAKSKERK